MTTNIVLITSGSRPRLLEQTLLTLYDNTPADQYNLTIVGDGNSEAINQWCLSTGKPLPSNWSPLIVFHPCNIVGRLRNLGGYWSEKQFGRGEWLCFIDDDVAFMPGWLEKMQLIMANSNILRLLGGVRHPYHGVNYEWANWNETDAVAGYCHFMRWSTWDVFGPYDAHAKGTGQSEDYALCRKVVNVGGKVGYIHPPVMAHCGLTDSSGKPILGGELIERQEGILYL